MIADIYMSFSVEEAHAEDPKSDNRPYGRR